MKRTTLLLATSLAACSPAPVTPNTAPDMALPKDPFGRHVVLTLEPFDVPAGTERQVCKTVLLSSTTPFDAIRLHSTMSGTSHHFNAYKYIDATQAVPATDLTLRDCQPGAQQLAGSAALILGAAIPDYTLDSPATVSYHLEPNEPIVLEQHVINAGKTTIQGGVTFDLFEAADVTTVKHHASIVWMANWKFGPIPTGQMYSDSGTCALPYDMVAFAVTTHTHHLGINVGVDAIDAGGTVLSHLYDNPDWSHPQYHELSPPLSVSTGQGFQWTCKWDNTGDHPVYPGKLSTDEMCMTYAYAYSSTSLDAHPVECNLF